MQIATGILNKITADKFDALYGHFLVFLGDRNPLQDAPRVAPCALQGVTAVLMPKSALHCLLTDDRWAVRWAILCQQSCANLLPRCWLSGPRSCWSAGSIASGGSR